VSPITDRKAKKTENAPLRSESPGKRGPKKGQKKNLKKQHPREEGGNLKYEIGICLKGEKKQQEIWTC